MVVVGRGGFDRDFSSQSFVAMPARFHLRSISAAHPRSRCADWANERFLAGPTPTHGLRFAGCSERLVFLFLETWRPPVAGAGLDVRGAVCAFPSGERAGLLYGGQVPPYFIPRGGGGVPPGGLRRGAPPPPRRKMAAAP